MSIVSLRHLQTENYDLLGEVAHCVTIIGYLALQNYNISRLSFYNYNFHLIMLTILFFAQRIWFFLWRAAQFSDAHGLRFAVHIVLFFVFLDSLYCGVQLALKESFAGSLYLVAPLLSSVLFYQVGLKAYTNVFTAELFGMLSRCVYHSLETSYCIGVLPLRFLQYEYLYFDTSRCMVLTMLVTAHSFLMLVCLELHCLGSEVLQQTRMLGSWRRIASPAGQAGEWSYHNCPYPRGAQVECKGRFYEASAMLNTSSPTFPAQCVAAIVFIFGDTERTKALVLGAVFGLNAALVHLILWSNQWALYALMLIPNCAHFMYIRWRRSHAFFNPVRLGLDQLQWDLSYEMSQHFKMNGAIGSNGTRRHGDSWGGSYTDDMSEGHYDQNSVFGDHDGGGHYLGAGLASSGGLSSIGDILAVGGVGRPQNAPLFMSAVSASTMFFFGAGRSPAELGAARHDGNDM